MQGQERGTKEMLAPCAAQRCAVWARRCASVFDFGGSGRLLSRPVDATRRAVIDVGTNSIKLLVADVHGQRVEPVWEGSKQTRLGRGLYQTQQLLPGAIAQTAEVAAQFAAIAREHQARCLRIIATSAAREARNALELTDAIQKAAGVKVEILTGEAEADLVFQGVATDPGLAGQPLLLLDVGGGSTEFILRQGEQKFFRASVSLGSVRLLETFPPSDPPRPDELSRCRQWAIEFLRQEVQPKLLPLIQSPPTGPEPATQPGFSLVGTGGTATILARLESQIDHYDRQRLEATRLSRQRLRWHVERLWSLSLAARQQLKGLPASRADVILTGSIIYDVVMEQFDIPELRVSLRGLRFGAVLA